MLKSEFTAAHWLEAPSCQLLSQRPQTLVGKGLSSTRQRQQGSVFIAKQLIDIVEANLSAATVAPKQSQSKSFKIRPMRRSDKENDPFAAQIPVNRHHSNSISAFVLAPCPLIHVSQLQLNHLWCSKTASTVAKPIQVYRQDNFLDCPQNVLIISSCLINCSLQSNYSVRPNQIAFIAALKFPDKNCRVSIKASSRTEAEKLASLLPPQANVAIFYLQTTYVQANQIYDITSLAQEAQEILVIEDLEHIGSELPICRQPIKFISTNLGPKNLVQLLKRLVWGASLTAETSSVGTIKELPLPWRKIQAQVTLECSVQMQIHPTRSRRPSIQRDRPVTERGTNTRSSSASSCRSQGQKTLSIPECREKLLSYLRIRVAERSGSSLKLPKTLAQLVGELYKNNNHIFMQVQSNKSIDSWPVITDPIDLDLPSTVTIHQYQH